METFGRYSGISDVTDAQRLALDLTNYKPPLLVETTDNGTWKWLGGSAWVQTHSGGATHISLNGVVTAVSGVMKSYPLDAINTDLTDSATNTTSFIEHAGLKGFSVENLDAIGAGEALIVAWSTVANDSASVASRLNSFATAVGTPDAAGYSNVIAISNGTKIVPEIFWDGTTSIKTIGVRIVGAAGIDVVVRAVEV